MLYENQMRDSTRRSIEFSPTMMDPDQEVCRSEITLYLHFELSCVKIPTFLPSVLILELRELHIVLKFGLGQVMKAQR